MSPILLVEADEAPRCSWRQTSERFGDAVVEAAEGVVALPQFDAGSGEFTLIAIVMPGRDGRETIVVLRQRASASKLIAMSGGGRRVGGTCLAMAHQFGESRLLRTPPGVVEAIGAMEGFYR